MCQFMLNSSASTPSGTSSYIKLVQNFGNIQPPLTSASKEFLPPTSQKPTTFYLPPSAFLLSSHLLPPASCLPLFASRLLSFAFCLLPPASHPQSHLPPPASCLLSPVSCLLPPISFLPLTFLASNFLPPSCFLSLAFCLLCSAPRPKLYGAFYLRRKPRNRTPRNTERKERVNLYAT